LQITKFPFFFLSSWVDLFWGLRILLIYFYFNKIFKLLCRVYQITFQHVNNQYQTRHLEAWQCGYSCFLNNFLCWNTYQWFFYFFKIIFDIITSKRSKTYKTYQILGKKIKFFGQPRSQTISSLHRTIRKINFLKS
jgi:hypothetical protein